MKKFSLMVVAAVVALCAWSGTATAQCATTSCGRTGFHLFGHHSVQAAPQCTYASEAVQYVQYAGCQHRWHLFGHRHCDQVVSCGCVSTTAVYHHPVVAPNPAQPAPESLPVPRTRPAPVTTPVDPVLPPKKLKSPNPRQDGPVGQMIIDGDVYGVLANGTYAKIGDGTYARLSGK